jgi:hypothetical protein
MNSDRRPLAVLLVSCLYMAVGAIGFLVYFPRLITLQHDNVWIELTELLAFVAGVFLFRGHNWARWLALVWMAFHVAISFPVVRQVISHSIILALIAWALVGPGTRRYFSPAKTDYE